MQYVIQYSTIKSENARNNEKADYAGLIRGLGLQRHLALATFIFTLFNVERYSFVYYYVQVNVKRSMRGVYC